MIELEIYAAGVRDLDKILALDHELESATGLRYKVDSNHDIVYFEYDEPIHAMDQILGFFHKLGLDPKVVGAPPPEIKSRSKTQALSVGGGS